MLTAYTLSWVIRKLKELTNRVARVEGLYGQITAQGPLMSFTTAAQAKGGTYTNGQIILIEYLETLEGGGGGFFKFVSAATGAENEDRLIPNDRTVSDPGRLIRQAYV